VETGAFKTIPENRERDTHAAALRALSRGTPAPTQVYFSLGSRLAELKSCKHGVRYVHASAIKRLHCRAACHKT
jgi:hypothetical protein